MKSSQSSIIIQPRAALLVLIAMIALLAGAHLVGLTMKQLNHERVFGLVRLFDMDRERNIPTLFSTCLFLASSFLSFTVARARWLREQPAKTWLLLSLVLLFLAVDEFCQIHEYLKDPTRKLLDVPDGFFGPAWVIPYGIAALAFFAVMVPFLMSQEKPIRRLLASSGAIFVGGAVGVEMLTGKYISLAEAARPDTFNMNVDLWYGVFVAIEESLEMLGVTILVFTLLTLLQKTYGGLTMTLPGGNSFQRPG